MKIAMMTDTYTPQINGVVTSIRLSAEELTRMGHEVYVFAPDFSGTQTSDGNVIRFASSGYPFKAIKEFQLTKGFGSIIHKMRELGIDLIHSHDPGSMGLKSVPISRYLKIPHIHTYHTFWPDYVHYVPLGSRYTKVTAEKFSALFCNRCDGIVAPTGKIRDALIQYGTRVPINIIPSGIRTENFSGLGSRELHQKYQIPQERKVLVYAGRVVKEKNVPFLLEMLDIIIHKMKRTDYHLILVGDGAARKELEAQAEKTGLAGYVTFTGFLPHHEVMEIFHQSDLFVFASLTETQGLVLLEAMASGIPAVVVDALGIGDLMIDGKGGFPVPHDTQAFAHTVVDLMENAELYARKKGEARQKADAYSLTNCTEKLEAFYKERLQAHRPRSTRYIINSVLRRRPYSQRKETPIPTLEEALENYFAIPGQWQNRYFIMRHGKSEANREGIIVSHFSNGLNSYGLTEEGTRQIEESLEHQTFLDHDTVIIASDFLRTRETAQVVSRKLGTRPPRTSPLLRERFFGRYEKREDIYYEVVWQLDEKNDRNSDYGVESPEEVQERIRVLIRQLEEEYSGEVILLISHGDTLQISQTWTEGLPAGLHRSLPHLETGEIRELIPRAPEFEDSENL